MSLPFLLSATGSGRATAYIESPKIITFRGKTHVTWLDTPPEGFRIKIRTLDHASGGWSEAWTIGEAADNHGGPALTVDGEGYLHVVYYSHHHPFRYHRSARPNDASAWSPMEQFGTDLTYPALLCAADGTLILSARRSHEEQPWELELWRKAPGRPWARQGAILRSQRPNYSQYAASMIWGADHRSIYLSFRIYEQPSYDKPPVSFTSVGCMTSPDEGATWARLDGTPIALPATAEATDIMVRNDSAEARIADAGAMALTPDGRPCIGYSVRMPDNAQGYLATARPGGGWRHVHLNRFLPAGWRDAALIFHGGVVFNAAGRLTIVCPAINHNDFYEAWGDPGTELVRLDSTDGGRTFRGCLLDAPDPNNPRWLPSLERPTGFNEVTLSPGLIYTEGGRGVGLDDVLTNKVWWRALA
jgi:hypothetical protein